MIAIRAAALVVAAPLATGCGTGQGVASATPQSPSLASATPASPSLAPAPTTSPPDASSSAHPTALHEGALAAGTFVTKPFAQPGSDACFVPPQPACTDSTDDDSIRVTLTVPDGWSGTPGDGVSPTSGQADEANLLFVRGASLYNDPCRTDASGDLPPEIPVGPTVDDFADAVAAHPLLEVTTPTDVTLAGYSGKYLELQVPADISKCDVYRPWEPWYYAQGPGERWHLWVLDVDGVRVVVQSMGHAGTSAQHRTELQAIVDSIQIEPLNATTDRVDGLNPRPARLVCERR